MQNSKGWDAINTEIISLYQQQPDGLAPERIERVVWLAEFLLETGQAEAIERVNERASLYGDLGLYALAEPLFRQTLAVQEKVFGPDHLEVAKCLNNLAWMYHDQKQYARAEPYYRRVLTIQERILGLEHHRLTRCINNLADLYRMQGLYAQAEPLYCRLTRICAHIDVDDPEALTSLRELAMQLIQERRDLAVMNQENS